MPEEQSRENVPRGDHVPGGPNDESVAEMNQKAERATRGADSAAQAGPGQDAGRRDEDDDAAEPTPT
jgi:hypothetical protein